jgi:guanosine-3',5'-bis(diphosphate) 3'-pyrophosphohydrolase
MKPTWARCATAVNPTSRTPIAVAAQCAEWKLDAQALMAALLHDAMEDCGVTKHDLIERFGAPVAELVDGLTKLDKLQFNTREESQAESFRKMLLAMARDVRVILIKLADRTHNMRTLVDMPRQKWGRIASETLDIYAPIAHRLGLNQTYRELQDLSFRHLQAVALPNPDEGSDQGAQQAAGSDPESAGVKWSLNLPQQGWRCASGRTRERRCTPFTEKMDEKHLSFAQVTDIYGFRVVVPGVTDCYTGFGHPAPDVQAGAGASSRTTSPLPS